jgi:hypothetical protein
MLNRDEIPKWKNSGNARVDSYEACILLKISRRTLQRLRASRTVNCFLRRGKIFYRISEIQRLLNEDIKNHTFHAK